MIEGATLLLDLYHYPPTFYPTYRTLVLLYTPLAHAGIPTMPITIHSTARRVKRDSPSVELQNLLVCLGLVFAFTLTAFGIAKLTEVLRTRTPAENAEVGLRYPLPMSLLTSSTDRDISRVPAEDNAQVLFPPCRRPSRPRGPHSKQCWSRPVPSKGSPAGLAHWQNTIYQGLAAPTAHQCSSLVRLPSPPPPLLQSPWANTAAQRHHRHPTREARLVHCGRGPEISRSRSTDTEDAPHA